MAPAVASPAVRSRSTRTTLAPARANSKAVARPMPLAPPVTSATLPVKSIASSVALGAILACRPAAPPPFMPLSFRRPAVLRLGGNEGGAAMEFGMFHEFQWSEGQTEADAFARSMEQVDAAERWGLDAMWLAELHMAPGRSVLSAPLTVASAIAARTTRMKIGTAVQVLPLCHPLRLADEAATVDQLSQGRLIFGIGRSGFPRTYEAYGVAYGESRERFAEILEILKRAWSQPSFSFEGKHYRFQNICMVPKPYQKPY